MQKLGLQVAKLYDRSSGKLVPAEPPDKLLSAICSFLDGCRRPVVFEAGDEPIALVEGQFSIAAQAGILRFEVWDDERSLTRRILAINRLSNGILDCTIQRFANRTGTLTFLDLDKPQTASRTVRAARLSFQERFHRMLSRQFPGWTIAALSSAMDLQRSFSAVFPRAKLIRGNQQIAAVACQHPEEEPLLLASALLWHDHLLAQSSPGGRVSLALFFPETGGNLTAHRLKWLTGRPLLPRLFRFNEHGMAGEVDATDLGNIETRISSHFVPVELRSDAQQLIARLENIYGVACCPELNGALSIRFRGLEFARVERERVLLGIEAKEEVTANAFKSIEDYALHLARFPETRSAVHTDLPTYPERWLESVVRSNLLDLGTDLLPEPVHGQVLTFAGGERELVDLLAISRSGRLSVIELKASQDIQLPLQGLDYWLRIGWHAERDELSGLFPGSIVSKELPRLLLVAPALEFHPSNEVVLRYFSPAVDVERIGVNSDWYRKWKILFRLKGAEPPISHRGSNEF